MTWKGLPNSTRNWIALGGAVVGVAGAIYGFGRGPTEELEAQVQGNTTRIERLEASDAAAAKKIDKVICLLLLPDSLSAIQSERNCP